MRQLLGARMNEDVQNENADVQNETFIIMKIFILVYILTACGGMMVLTRSEFGKNQKSYSVFVSRHRVIQFGSM